MFHCSIACYYGASLDEKDEMYLVIRFQSFIWFGVSFSDTFVYDVITFITTN